MKKLMNFRLPEDVIEWLRAEGRQKGLSMTTIIIMVIRDRIATK